MTPKELAARDIRAIARQWEDGARFATIVAERHITVYALKILLQAHFGGVRYTAISKEHRRTGRVTAGNLFKEGNTAHLRRKHRRGTPKCPVHSIRKWKRQGQLRRYMKTGHGNGGAYWQAVSILIWEKLHGPVPKGCYVGFKDGNSLNDDPENLYLVSRSDCARLAGKLGSVTRRVTAERKRKLLSLQENAA